MGDAWKCSEGLDNEDYLSLSDGMTVNLHCHSITRGYWVLC